jgi:DNA mismatch endonuclease, patch repair protein
MAPDVRHRVMASIRKVDTKPELALRRALTAAHLTGYRLHAPGLPGRPDVAYQRWQVAVFVDGVFWHGHPDHFRPGSLSEYWDDKIARNKARDEDVTERLRAEGWDVLRFWDLDVLAATDEVVERVREALAIRGRPAANA